MPFKSKAHMDKFKELLAAKKISQKDFDKMLKDTKDPHKLPDRVK